MASEQKLFLAKVAASWHREFPFLKAVNLIEIPRVPKGCNYLCDFYGKSRSRYYFICFDFSRKRRGEFSIGVTISPTPDRSTLDPAMVKEPTSISIGSFGVWQFMGRQWFAWSLVDLETELIAVLGVPSGLPPSTDVWCPSTFSQPIEKIVEEAVTHVNQTLRNHVFPILQIEV